MFGNLYLTEKIGGTLFTDEDEYIAVLLGNSLGAVVENARHHEESARLLEEVQQLHRARERFFAMVNHELRNALAAVYGWAEMLVRKKDPSTVPPAAYEVLDSAQQAIALINDSDLGLQAAVFTSSLKRAFRFVHGLRAGSVVVNDSTGFWEPHPPFGGASGTRTGWGRIGGKYTLLDMTDLRTAVIDTKKTKD